MTAATSGLTSGSCRAGRSRSIGTKVFAYLTVAENCQVGVCSHELGHLLFGWPDLYDVDDSSGGARRLVPDGGRQLERRR